VLAPSVLLAVSAATHFATYFGLAAPDRLLVMLLVGALLTFVPAMLLAYSTRRRVPTWDLIDALPRAFVIVGVLLGTYVLVTFFVYLGATLSGAQARETQIRFWTGHPMLFQYVALGVFLAQMRLGPGDRTARRRPVPPSNVYAVSREAHWLTLASAAIPIVGGVVLIALLPSLPQASPGPGTVFGLVLAGVLVSWLVRAAAALRRVAWVEVREQGLRTRDFLGRERSVGWAEIGDVREHGDRVGRPEMRQVGVVGHDGRILITLRPRLRHFDVLLEEIRLHSQAAD
jgi:hypothetical protein